MIAAIYARKSTEQDGVKEEAKSVTRQIEHAKDYARRKGWRRCPSTSTPTTAFLAPSSPSAPGLIGR